MKAGKTDFEVGTLVRVVKSDDPELIGVIGRITHPFCGLQMSGVYYIAGLYDIVPSGIYSGDICVLTKSDIVEKV